MSKKNIANSLNPINRHVDASYSTHDPIISTGNTDDLDEELLNCKLFFGSNHHLDTQVLQQHFSRFGTVLEIYLRPETGTSGNVTFYEPKDPIQLLKEHQYMNLPDGSSLEIKEWSSRYNLKCRDIAHIKGLRSVMTNQMQKKTVNPSGTNIMTTIPSTSLQNHELNQGNQGNKVSNSNIHSINESNSTKRFSHHPNDLNSTSLTSSINPLSNGPNSNTHDHHTPLEFSVSSLPNFIGFDTKTQFKLQIKNKHNTTRILQSITHPKVLRLLGDHGSNSSISSINTNPSNPTTMKTIITTTNKSKSKSSWKGSPIIIGGESNLYIEKSRLNHGQVEMLSTIFSMTIKERGFCELDFELDTTGFPSTSLSSRVKKGPTNTLVYFYRLALSFIFSNGYQANYSIPIRISDREMSQKLKPIELSSIIRPISLASRKIIAAFPEGRTSRFPLLNQHSILSNHLQNGNDYQLPMDIIRDVEQIGHSKNINPWNLRDNYKSRMHNLLYVEEAEQCKLMREFDMFNVSLIPVTSYTVRGTVHFVDHMEPILRLKVPGLMEKRPSILPGDTIYLWIPDTNDVEYEGYVNIVEMDTILVMFHLDFHQHIFSTSSVYNVRFSFNRHSFLLSHRSLDQVDLNLVWPQQTSSMTLLDDKKLSSKIIPIHEIKAFDEAIAENPNQLLALYNALNRYWIPNNVPYLIFGAFGTGKTKILVELLQQIIYGIEEAKILVCAPSNSAADVFAVKLAISTLINKKCIFRLYSPHRSLHMVPNDIRECISFDYQKQSFDIPDLESLKRFRVIVSTCTSASMLHAVGLKDHFTHILLDEVAQVMEPEALIPLTLANTKTSIVMAGDPKQMGSQIHSKSVRHHELSRSIMDRMSTLPAYHQSILNSSSSSSSVSNNPNLIYLTENYRSHHLILQFASQQFYNNSLKAMANHSIIKEVGTDFLPNPEFPIVFHGIEGEDMRESDSPSFFNPYEVTRITELIFELLHTKDGMIKQKDIGVISPFYKQVQKIRASLRQHGLFKVLVSGINEMQGKEFKVVFITTVRTSVKYQEDDTKHELGFFYDGRTLNTALTRATCLAVIVGDPFTVSRYQHWKQLISYCISNNAYMGQPFNQEYIRHRTELESDKIKQPDIVVDVSKPISPTKINSNLGVTQKSEDIPPSLGHDFPAHLPSDQLDLSPSNENHSKSDEKIDYNSSRLTQTYQFQVNHEYSPSHPTHLDNSSKRTGFSSFSSSSPLNIVSDKSELNKSSPIHSHSNWINYTVKPSSLSPSSTSSSTLASTPTNQINPLDENIVHSTSNIVASPDHSLHSSLFLPPSYSNTSLSHYECKIPPFNDSKSHPNASHLHPHHHLYGGHQPYSNNVYSDPSLLDVPNTWKNNSNHPNLTMSHNGSRIKEHENNDCNLVSMSTLNTTESNPSVSNLSRPLIVTHRTGKYISICRYHNSQEFIAVEEPFLATPISIFDSFTSLDIHIDKFCYNANITRAGFNVYIDLVQDSGNAIWCNPLLIPETHLLVRIPEEYHDRSWEILESAAVIYIKLRKSVTHHIQPKLVTDTIIESRIMSIESNLNSMPMALGNNSPYLSLVQPPGLGLPSKPTNFGTHLNYNMNQDNPNVLNLP